MLKVSHVLTIATVLNIIVSSQQEITSFILPNSSNRTRLSKIPSISSFTSDAKIQILCSENLKRVRVYHGSMELCNVGSIRIKNEEIGAFFDDIRISLKSDNNNKDNLVIEYDILTSNDEKSVKETIKQRFRVLGEIGIKMLNHRIERNEGSNSKFAVKIAKISEDFLSVAHHENIKVKLANGQIPHWLIIGLKDGHIIAHGKFPNTSFESTNFDIVLTDNKANVHSKVMKIHLICDKGEVPHEPMLILIFFILVSWILIYGTYTLLQCCRDELKKFDGIKTNDCLERERINQNDSCDNTRSEDALEVERSGRCEHQDGLQFRSNAYIFEDNLSDEDGEFGYAKEATAVSGANEFIDFHN